MTLADIEIRRTLGTGSFGRVVLIRHKPTKKYYAMKILKKAQVVRLKQVRARGPPAAVRVARVPELTGGARGRSRFARVPPATAGRWSTPSTRKPFSRASPTRSSCSW